MALVILVVATALEGFSFRTVIRESDKVRAGASWPGFIRATKDPDLVLVLLEDAAALVGLSLALIGIVLGELTGHAVGWRGNARSRASQKCPPTALLL